MDYPHIPKTELLCRALVLVGVVVVEGEGEGVVVVLERGGKYRLPIWGFGVDTLW